MAECDSQVDRRRGAAKRKREKKKKAGRQPIKIK